MQCYYNIWLLNWELLVKWDLVKQFERERVKTRNHFAGFNGLAIMATDIVEVIGASIAFIYFLIFRLCRNLLRYLRFIIIVVNESWFRKIVR